MTLRSGCRGNVVAKTRSSAKEVVAWEPSSELQRQAHGKSSRHDQQDLCTSHKSRGAYPDPQVVGSLRDRRRPERTRGVERAGGEGREDGEQDAKRDADRERRCMAHAQHCQQPRDESTPLVPKSASQDQKGTRKCSSIESVNSWMWIVFTTVAGLCT